MTFLYDFYVFYLTYFIKINIIAKAFYLELLGLLEPITVLCTGQSSINH